MKYECVVCGKDNLDKDTIGINKKLLGTEILNFYCLDCLADYLECTVDELLEKRNLRLKAANSLCKE
jgi:uncharacterized protein YlaI